MAGGGLEMPQQAPIFQVSALSANLNMENAHGKHRPFQPV
jgi:hypothetical protein